MENDLKVFSKILFLSIWVNGYTFRSDVFSLRRKLMFHVEKPSRQLGKCVGSEEVLGLEK